MESPPTVPLDLDDLPSHPIYMEQIHFESTLEATPPLLRATKGASYFSIEPEHQRPVTTHEEPSCVQGSPLYSRRTDFYDDVVVAPSNTRVFVAVMDYDPTSLCTTGRPDLELTLQTGMYDQLL